MTTPTQTLVVLVLVVASFVGGLGVGSLDDPTETPPEIRYVKALSGRFEDVPLTMRANTGNTYHWICDMEFSHVLGNEDSAQCEFKDQP